MAVKENTISPIRSYERENTDEEREQEKYMKVKGKKNMSEEW